MSEPGMVACQCGCGQRFYGYPGEFWSAECVLNYRFEEGDTPE